MQRQRDFLKLVYCHMRQQTRSACLKDLNGKVWDIRVHVHVCVYMSAHVHTQIHIAFAHIVHAPKK